MITQNDEIIFSISPESICQALQINPQASLHPFSIGSLMDLYKNLTFPQIVHIFECFLPKNDELPRTNPPYPVPIFPRDVKTGNFHGDLVTWL